LRGFCGEGKVHHKVILLLCVVIVAASLVFQACDDGIRLFGVGCPVHCFLYEAVGVKCALCGLSRSFCSLAHGDFHRATAFHYCGPLIFGFVCMQIPYRIFAASGKAGRINLFLSAAIAAAIFVNWLIYLGGLIL